MQNNPFKKIIILVISLLATLLTAVGVTFAIIANQNVNRTHQIDIESTNVTFIYNNKTYFDEIGTDNINLDKGVPSDVKLKIEIVGTKKFMVNYRVDFDLEINEQNREKSEMLAKAIEVYVLEDGHYKSIGDLNDFSNYFYSSQMITNYSKEVFLRFIYSKETSTSYDNLAKEGNIRIVTRANAETMDNAEYIYIDESNDFKEALLSNNNVTIVLINDITLNEDLTVSNRIGIDLNGHNLTLNNNINISYTQDSFDETKRGLIDSQGTGNLLGTGKITVSTNESYLVSKNISNLRYSISNVNSHLSDLSLTIKSRLKDIEGTYHYPGEDLTYILKDLEYYISYFGLTSEEGVISYNDGILKILDSENINITTTYSYSLRLSGAYIDGNIQLYGNSLEQIALDIKNSIPDTISSTILLKTYDQYRNVYIDWSVQDGLDNNLMNNNGIYLPNGKAFMETIDSLEDTDILFTMKLVKGINHYVYSFVKTGELISIEDKGNLLIDSQPLALNSNTIYSGYALSNETLNKYGVKKFEIIFPSNEEPYKYLSVTPDNRIIVDALEQNYRKEGTLNVKLTFNDNRTFVKEVHFLLLGDNSYVTEYDILYRLEKAFKDNMYTRGEGREFLVPGSLSPQSSNESKEIFVQYTFDNSIKDAISALTKYSLVSEYEDQISYYLKDGANYVFIRNLNNLTYVYKKVVSPTLGNEYFILIDGKYQKTNDLSLGVNYYSRHTALFEYQEANPTDNSKTYYVFSNGRYIEANDLSIDRTYYERIAVEKDIYRKDICIEILFNKISFVNNKDVNVHAVLYTLDSEGNIHYVDDVPGINVSGDEWKKMEYDFSFTIKGIIQNNENGILDHNLYSFLLACFDCNGDSIINFDESELTWDEIIQNAINNGYSSLIGTVLDSKAPDYNNKYLKFENMNITSIKGIEYFQNIEGLSLENTSISNISYLESLKRLKYLDLSNNNIADLSSISLMDDIITLDLSFNHISDIEPLRYLKAISSLNLDSNTIADFEPLTEMTTLRMLNVSNMKKNDSISLALDASSKYAWALVIANNKNLSNITYKLGSSTYTITASLVEQAIAKAMKDVYMINRVYKTLYLPTVYYYGGVTYELEWFNDSNANIILQKPDGNHNYQLYEIKNPFIDKALTLRVQAKNGSNYYAITRTFNITIEKEPGTEAILYYNKQYIDLLEKDISTGKLKFIEDESLLSAIFEKFNTITEGSYDGKDEKNLVSLDDWNSFDEVNIDFSYKNITSLKGIECLNMVGHTFTLDLSGNKIDDLSPLILIKDKIKSLKLGGYNYDIATLVGDDESGRITNLEVLDVSNCYQIDEYLPELYELYIHNPVVKIYIETSYDTDSNAYWNPYEELLPIYLSEIPSVLTFGMVNQSYYIYDMISGDTSKNSYTFNFYGYDYDFYLDSSSSKLYYPTSVSAYNNFKLRNNNELYLASIPPQSGSYGFDLYLSASDTHGEISCNTLIQLNYLGIEQRIVVHNSKGENFADYSSSAVLLKNLIASPEVRVIVLARLNDNGFRMFSSDDYRYKDGSLNDYLSFDASLNATSLSVCRYYLKDDVYHISTNVLANITPGEITINGPSDHESKTLLYGLRYLPKVTRVTINRDFAFGDGADLVNLTSLVVKYGSIDMTKLRYQLKITTMSFTECFYFNSNAEVVKNYLPDLASFTYSYQWTKDKKICFLDDYRWTKGLIDENGKSKITVFNVYKSIENSSKRGIIVKNVEYIKDLYLASLKNQNNDKNKLSFKIGSPSKNEDQSYFFSVDDLGNMGVSTSKNPDSFDMMWEESSEAINSAFDTKDNINLDNIVNNNMINGLGLRVDGTTYVSLASTDSRRTKITTSNYITVPSSSGKELYGLVYGNNSTIYNSYPITWKYIYNPSGSYSSSNLWSLTNNTLQGDLDTSSLSSYFTITLESEVYKIVPKSSANGYLFLFGILNNTYLYGYDFVVNSGDNLFTSLPDVTLREYLFSLSKSNPKTAINATSAILKKNVMNNIFKNSFSNSYTYLVENTSNYILSVDGAFTLLNSIVNASNPSKSFAASITTVKLNSQKMTSIDGLITDGTNYLSALSVLSLENTDLRLSNHISKIDTLSDVDLKKSNSITPDDLKCLPVGISKLNIYRTRCLYNIDTVSQLIRICDKQEKSITLGWHLASETAVTLDNLTKLKTIIDSINDDTYSDLALNGGTKEYTEYKISSFAYSVYSVKTVSSDKINASITLDASAINAQFGTSLFVYANYKPSEVMQGTKNYIGNAKKEISEFDADLICYLVNIGYLNLNSSTNEFYIPSIKSIRPNGIAQYLAIRSFKGFKTSTVTNKDNRKSIRLYLENQTDKYKDNYIEFVLADSLDASVLPNFKYTDDGGLLNANSPSYVRELTYPVLSNEVFNVNNVPLNGLPSYLYYSNSTKVYTIKLPTGIYLEGTLYPISYTIAESEGNTSVNNGLSYNSETGILSINTNELPDGLEAANYIINIKAELSNGSNFTSTFDISKGDETYSHVIQNYQGYIEVSPIDGFNGDASYKYAILDSDNNPIHKTRDTYYVYKENEVITLYSNNEGDYTLSNASGIVKTHVVSASEVFDSTSFLVCVLQGLSVNKTTGEHFPDDRTTVDGTTSINLYPKENEEFLYKYEPYFVFDVEDGEEFRDGIIIPNILRLSVERFLLLYTWNAGDSLGGSTFQGIQIFANINEFSCPHLSVMGSIEPLRYLHLVDFSFKNTYQNTLTRIFDFTPLIEGSKETLRNFNYGYNLGVIHTDLSFLLAFPKLEKVYTNYNKSNGDIKDVAWFYNMSHTKEFIYELYQNPNFVGFYVNSGFNSYIEESVKEGDYCKINPMQDTKDAFTLYKNYSPLANVEFIDGYALNISSSAYTLNGNYATTYVSASINNNGELSLIEYIPGQQNVTIEGYVLDNNITINGVTYYSNQILSKDDALIIVGSLEYYNANKSGEVTLTCKIRISVSDVTNIDRLFYSSIIARIKIRGLYFDKALTLYLCK